MMIRKLIVTGFVVGAVFALTMPTAVYARPSYVFGGGERAVHINEGAFTASTAQSTHISTIQHGYEYGAFLGTLTVERLGRSVNIYGGATLDAMDKGAGHFSFTGLESGNVGLIGHNRGTRTGFFSFVRLLQEGDIIRLDVNGIIRTYEVHMRTVVDEVDFSPLQQFGDNRLTLVTCIEDVRNQRRIVVCREILEGGL